MRIHPISRRVAHGIAGAGLFVDNIRVPRRDTAGQPVTGGAGMPDWWGDRLIYIGGDILRTCDVDGSDDRPVEDRPALVSLVRASRHGWAAWSPTGGPSGRPIVWTSWGLRIVGAVLLDMAPQDGAVVVGDHYHPEEGTGLSVYMPGQSQAAVHIPDARPAVYLPYPQAAALMRHAVIWTEDGGRTIRSSWGERMMLPWVALHPTVIELPDRLGVVYGRGDDTVVAQPWGGDPRRGLLMSPGGFGPTGMVQDGRVVLLASRTTAEGAGDIRQSPPLDPSRLVDLPAVGGTEPPVEPPSPGPTLPVDPPQQPLAVHVLEWTERGMVPIDVRVRYEITGHAAAPVVVALLLDGEAVTESDQPAGALTSTLTEPGEYRLMVRVTAAGRTAETGLERIVTALPAPVEPPAPPPSPPPVPPEPPMTDPLDTLGREAAESAVRILYRHLLDRDPDPDGFTHAVHALRHGLPIAGLEERIIDSAEYRARIPAPRPTPPPPGPAPGLWVAPAWWRSVTEDQLRSFRGDLGGMRVSSRLGPKDRPSSPDDYVFTPTYCSFPPELRAMMRAAVKARRYKHFSIGPIWERGYPGWSGHNFLEDPMTYIGFLRELIDDGLIPVVWAMADGPFNVHRPASGNDGNPIDFEEVARILTPIYAMPEMQEVVKVVIGGWEVTDNGWVKRIPLAVALYEWLADVFPDAFRYHHAAANNGAPCNYDTDGHGCERPAWLAIAPLIHGHFWQDASMGGWHMDGWDPSNPEHRRQAFEANLRYDVNRIRGNHYQHGGLIGADGKVLDVIAGEYSAYFELNDGFDESASIAYGALAMSVEGVRGFMDGGPA